MENLIETQLQIEEDYKDLGKDSLEKSINAAKARGEAATSTDVGRWAFGYRIHKFRRDVLSWVEAITKPKAGAKSDYISLIYDLLRTYKDPNKTEEATMLEVSEMLSCATLATIINHIGYNNDWQPLNNVAVALGMAIQNEFQTKAFENYLADPANKEKKNALVGIDKRIGAGYRKAYLARAIKLNKFKAPEWEGETRAALGIALLSHCALSTSYFEICRVYGYKQEIYRPTQAFTNAWRNGESNLLQLAHKLCPMVIPPAKWESYEMGGYIGALSHFHNLLRLKSTHNRFGKEYIKRINNEVDLSKVMSAVNAIQETPWKINKEVLRVMLYFKGLGYLPCGGETDINGNPINFVYMEEAPKPVAPLDKNTKYTKEQIEAYCKAMIPYYKYEGRRGALSYRAGNIVDIADKFSKYERIYFPHNMDFRGRVYPIPVFSPQGDDLSKSLLLFADVPPCESEEDINFLAITGANLAGVDKVSYDDRIKWVYDNEEQILAVAADPIEYRNWWMSQDEPCQMLAWCFEWAKAKKWIAEHGSIVGFVTGFPYAQDGTCSGLQHFSAILRDPIGGKAVNLVPQDKPNDIYAQVAVKVNEMLQEDAINGEGDVWDEEKLKYKYGNKTLAQVWINYGESVGVKGGINRKVTKRPTMTLAYGAKKMGYKNQIIDDTIKPAMRKKGDSCVFTEKNATQAAIYMADLIWKAVSETVVKAVEGMDWLHKCATIVCKNAQVVSWVTPVGLPVQQNYPKYEMKVTALRCMGKRFRIYTPKQTGKIDIAHQTQAVAPNFIHSMDAAHLQLTVLNSVSEGIHHFAMIHDSYGCPMSQASKMYRIVRETFINMYSERDVLADFRKELSSLVEKGVVLPEPPVKGDLDLNCVKDSKYIFC